MATIIERLEKIGENVLNELEKKPVRTVILSILIIWLVGKVIKSLK